MIEIFKVPKTNADEAIENSAFDKNSTQLSCERAGRKQKHEEIQQEIMQKVNSSV